MSTDDEASLSNSAISDDFYLADPAMMLRQRPLYRAAVDKTPKHPPSAQTPEGSRTIGIMARWCIFLLVIFVAFSLLYLSVSSVEPYPRAETTLRKAFVLFRHGTRAPGFTYKNDRFHKDNEKYWPDGPGELTAARKIEAYELGERLRERYEGFIGDYYKAKEFRAYTTLIERTMMSAQLVLASLFPPKGYQAWSNQMNWQPVPVYPNEIVNATHGTSCPRFALEFKDSIKRFNAQLGFNTKMVKALKENSGEPDEIPFSLFTKVFDSVYFQNRANLPIPEWLRPFYPEELATSAVKYMKMFLAGSRTQEMLVLDPFGRAIVNFFTNSPRKMELHSMHDIHIMTLFLLFDIEVNSFPEPGSAISIELHEKSDGQYFEVYYYPTPKDKMPTQMKMPCGMSCPISELTKRCKSFEVENYDELCSDGEGGVLTHITEFKLQL